MSGWVGLREDQREGEVLAMRIAVLFPVDRVRVYRALARANEGRAK